MSHTANEPRILEEGGTYKFSIDSLIEFVEKGRAVGPQQCINLMRNYLRAVQPVIRPWIPIAKALPENGQIIIAAGIGISACVQYLDGEYHQGVFSSDKPVVRKGINWPVTHWMPFPETPTP